MLETGAEALGAAQDRVEKLGKKEAIEIVEAIIAVGAVSVGTAVIHDKIVACFEALTPSVPRVLYGAAKDIGELKKTMIVLTGFAHRMSPKDQLVLRKLRKDRFAPFGLRHRKSTPFFNKNVGCFIITHAI